MAITPGEGVTVVEVAELAAPTHRVDSLLLPNTQAGGVVFSRACSLMGVVLYNSAGTAVVLRLYNGPGIGGSELLAVSTPTTATPFALWMGPEGVRCDGGIYWASSLTGTCEFVVYYRYRVGG